MISDLWYQRHEPLLRRALLSPLWLAAQGFAAISDARRALYRHGLLAAHRPPAPVISVGNLVAGGAGKTPVVLYLAEQLLGLGRRVAILSRGYGRRGDHAVTVVSDGAGARASLDLSGDEPQLLARRCPRAVVLVGPRRSALADLACARFNTDALLLDDGFQHLSLRRDLDLVVVDAAAPFGNGHLLPRGPLREQPAALARAQLVWLSKVDLSAPAELDALRRQVTRATGRPPVEAVYRVSDVLDASLSTSFGADALRGKRVLLLAGLARPDSFRALLGRLGCSVAAEAIFPDHHPYTPEEIAGVLDQARSEDCEMVVCTEKDAVRLPAAAGASIRVARIAVEVISGADVLGELLAAALAGGQTA